MDNYHKNASVTNSAMIDIQLDASLSEPELADILISVVVYAVIMMIIGTVGNITVCYVYSSGYRITTSSYFIRCLAILDLTSCTVCIPLEISMLRLPLTFDIPELCKLLRFSRSATSMASGITLLAIAIDRYIKICRPIQIPISTKSAKRACYVACGAAVVFSAPTLIIFGNKGLEYHRIAETSCSTTESLQGTIYPTLYYSFLFFLFFGTSTCLAILYLFVAVKVFKHRRLRKLASTRFVCTANYMQRTNSNSTTGSEENEKRKIKPDEPSTPSLPRMSLNSFQQKKSSISSVMSSLRRSKPKIIFRHRTTIMLILITVIYFFSMMPYFAAMVYRSVIPNFDNSLNIAGQITYNFCLLSYFLSSCINPFIYGFCSQHFRNEFRKLMRRMRNFCSGNI